ncbi:Gfo/Idh/MocA family oxidoreductase [Paenibacillus sp. JMULE4]|uniref:Gfo/Idh/MocA family protein n=1 Tax=Paenibacillus TaxID=44249 RepID=UPI001575AC5F|nr:Gfo/Idh/MocA family oxidoreductase [Paenibacillus sp. JMULE4]NTZ20095.1 Gfo/Idh/MocA family oxidoreductase [Paenibacillus sp. JMULE4]
MPDKIRFAIVGAGVIAKYHAESIRQHPDAELAAVADNSTEKAGRLTEGLTDARLFKDYREMLKMEDIDVVCVCTPSGSHSDVTIAAAQAGKHVLCEKPLDINGDRMTAMIDACRKAGVKLGCVFQRRLMPAMLHARQALQDGKIGRPVLGNAYLKYYRSPEYYKSGGWRGTWRLDGGGALMNQGVHGVDLIQYIMGEVESVFAYTATLAREIEVEDTAVAALKYKSGAFGIIQAATSVYPGQETRFEIHGDQGTIEFGDEGIKQWTFMGHDEPAPVLEDTLGLASSSNPQQISIAGHYFYVDDMIQAIRGNREPHVNGEEARKSVDLILAIYESARSGKEVKV